MREQRDHYRTLGIPRDADLEAIKRAYRSQAKQAHPDARGGDDAWFSDLSDAYQTLKDSARRCEHDRELRRREGITGHADWTPHEDLDRFAAGQDWGLSHLFDLFGGILGSHGWWSGDVRLSTDVHMTLELNPMEATHGLDVPIELTEEDLRRPWPSSGWGSRPFTCQLVAAVPAGVRDGELLRYRFHDGDGTARMLQLHVRIVAEDGLS